MGVYGGMLVDSNEASLRERRKKLKKDLVEKIEDSTMHLDSTHEKEPGLFADILEVVILEAPIVLVVVVSGMIIGHFEGWGYIER